MDQDFKLDKDLGSNKYNYFFSLLGPRFDAMNKLMAESLSRRFGKKFKAIRILSAHPNKYFNKGNYIVLNKQAEEIEKELNEKVIKLQEYEDLNIEFTESKLISEVAAKLIKKQDRVFVYPFTTSFLNLKDSFWQIIGPNREVATYYDSKVKQHELFKKLELPRNETRVFKNKEALIKARGIFPCYITASYTSGGGESGLIYSKDMLDSFISRLRDVNSKNSFLVSSIFEHIVVSPNVNAIVTSDGKAHVLVISDQIMRGNRYLGNTYPSLISKKHVEEVKEITNKIGMYLSKKGYRGLFGCDFLINKRGELVIVDLNPRRQGGYGCNALALKAVGIDLTDLELASTLGENMEVNLDYNSIQYKKSWAHSKAKPNDPGQRIIAESTEGDIVDIFNELNRGSYKTSFYKKDSIFIDGYIGYTASSGENRKEVYSKITDTANEIIEEVLA
jgi:predicted ATP-grasp superfamily ATP-dependent carboligase